MKDIPILTPICALIISYKYIQHLSNGGTFIVPTTIKTITILPEQVTKYTCCVAFIIVFGCLWSRHLGGIRRFNDLFSVLILNNVYLALIFGDIIEYTPILNEFLEYDINFLDQIIHFFPLGGFLIVLQHFFGLLDTAACSAINSLMSSRDPLEEEWRNLDNDIRADSLFSDQVPQETEEQDTVEQKEELPEKEEEFKLKSRIQVLKERMEEDDT
ncbi:MAG: hypothetical protein HXS54_01195 [Theionarchaea archaeon]|nr:hypothetical protein [Theionarchaea archaeon]